MNFVALKMLMGDRAKYLGLIFTIAFASFLLANQVSIFCNIMLRTASQYRRRARCRSVGHGSGDAIFRRKQGPYRE